MYALTDPTVKRVVAVAASESGGIPPVPNYGSALSIEALIDAEKARAQKRTDTLVNLANLRVVASDIDDNALALVGEYDLFDQPRALNHIAEAQLANRMGVPSPFFRRCSTDLKLHIVQEHGGAFRVLGNDQRIDKDCFIRIDDDGQVRALLGSGYKVLDQVEVMEATFKLFASGDAAAAYLSIGDEYLHGRILFPSHEQTLGKGEKLIPGVQIRNSEVGMSSLSWAPMLFRVSCWNGLIYAAHSGGDLGDEATTSMYQRHTGKNAADVFAKLDKAMAEIIAGLPQRLEQVQRAAAKDVLDGHEYLETSIHRYGLPKTLLTPFLESAAEHNAKTAWDFINAVTASAQGRGLDQRIIIERAAGKMLAAVKN